MISQSPAEMGDNGEEVICTVTANDRKIFVSVNYTGAFIETTNVGKSLHILCMHTVTMNYTCCSS